MILFDFQIFHLCFFGGASFSWLQQIQKSELAAELVWEDRTTDPPQVGQFLLGFFWVSLISPKKQKKNMDDWPMDETDEIYMFL